MLSLKKVGHLQMVIVAYLISGKSQLAYVMKQIVQDR